MSGRAEHVVVVGAGIIGASIAWHLVRAGLRVTIIDAQDIGGVASPCSFGWINATYGNPRPYYDLRCRSMEEWERLASEVDGLPYRKSGTLYLDFERFDLDAFFARHAAWGYGLRWIDSDEARALEPNLSSLPERMLFSESEGVAEAAETARLLIRTCGAEGAEILTRTKVRNLIRHGSRVSGVLTENAEILADEVFMAAGAETPEIASTAGIYIPLRTPPGLLIHTRPHAPLVNRTILTTGLHFRQQRDGAIIAGADFGGGGTNDEPAVSGARLLKLLQAGLRGAEDLAVARTTTGFRPTPEDGFPVIGRVPGLDGLYLAVMHSGVTLAPAVGLFAAQEIVERQRPDLLRPFGADRFEMRAATN